MDSRVIIYRSGRCRRMHHTVKQLRQLHEEFLDKARRPMDFGRLPVLPRGRDIPVIAANRWNKSNNSLVKIYDFISMELRNDFVRQLLIFEEERGHHAKLTIHEESVTLEIQTRDVEQVTELDKEYAKYADELYKDVVYSLSHDR